MARAWCIFVPIHEWDFPDVLESKDKDDSAQRQRQ